MSMLNGGAARVMSWSGVAALVGLIVAAGSGYRWVGGVDVRVASLEGAQLADAAARAALQSGFQRDLARLETEVINLKHENIELRNEGYAAIRSVSGEIAELATEVSVGTTKIEAVRSSLEEVKRDIRRISERIDGHGGVRSYPGAFNDPGMGWEEE